MDLWRHLSYLLCVATRFVSFKNLLKFSIYKRTIKWSYRTSTNYNKPLHEQNSVNSEIKPQIQKAKYLLRSQKYFPQSTPIFQRPFRIFLYNFCTRHRPTPWSVSPLFDNIIHSSEGQTMAVPLIISLVQTRFVDSINGAMNGVVNILPPWKWERLLAFLGYVVFFFFCFMPVAFIVFFEMCCDHKCIAS